MIMADSDKLGKDDFVCVGKLKSGDTLITDSDADPDIVKLYRDMGVEIILA